MNNFTLKCFAYLNLILLFFQLVEVNSKARIKLSEDVEKVTIPGKKSAYRLYGSDGRYIGIQMDLIL